MLKLFRKRDFTLFWLGSLISLFGDIMISNAFPFYIYTVSGSALAAGAMYIAGALPSLLLGSIAGVFVDRWNRKLTMIMANILSAIVLFPLLLTNSGNSIWIITFVVFVGSTISLFFNPSESALLPQLVDKEDLMAANSLKATSISVATLVGPPLGGLLLGIAGLQGITIIDLLSFVASAFIFMLIKASGAPGQNESRNTPLSLTKTTGVMTGFLQFWRSWLDGFRLIRAEQWLKAFFVVSSLVVMGANIRSVLLILFAEKGLHTNAFEFGLLLTIQAIGGLVGVFVLRYYKSAQLGRLLGLGSLLIGLALGILVNIPGIALPLVMVLFALIGIGSTANRISSETLLQSGIKSQFRGRINGTLSTSDALVMISGRAVAAGAESLLGVGVMLSIAAILYVAGGIVAWTKLSYVKIQESAQEEIEDTSQEISRRITSVLVDITQECSPLYVRSKSGFIKLKPELAATTIGPQQITPRIPMYAHPEMPAQLHQYGSSYHRVSNNFARYQAKRRTSPLFERQKSGFMKSKSYSTQASKPQRESA